MRHLLRRVSVLLLTLWTAVTLNFLIPRLMPGNPAQAMLAKFHGKGTLNPQALHSIEVMLGISNENLLQQYLQYWQNMIHFNFGLSYTYFPYSVSYVIGQALPWTLVLVGVTAILGFVFGTLLGIWSAWRQGSTFDSLITSIFTFTSAFPYFWFALLLIYLLGYTWSVFPLNGGASGSIPPSFSPAFIGSAVYHSILPAFTILVSSIGGWQLGMRNNMLSTLSEDYIVLARARGLPKRMIALQYAARNAILPNLTGFAMSLGFIVGGAVLTEVVFGYPGMGSLLYNAVSNEDYPLMQGIFLIIVLCVVFANLIADIFTVLVDPRIRREGA